MRRHVSIGIVACAYACSEVRTTTTSDASPPEGDASTLPDGYAPDDAGPIVAPEPISDFIVVDQFGYRPGSEKIAVLRSPEQGFDASKKYAPGAKYALVDAHSQKRVFEGQATPWNSGATDASSGDKAWWFDFTSVQTPGDYYVLDETANVRSDVFRISLDVYRRALEAAVRMLYYQRDGIAKDAKYAGADWADGVSHMGPGQGTQCTLYNGNTVKDVHGGWWDAGDQNKYTRWAAEDAIILLRAYEENPSAFRDDTNIPESGNGTPDVLDEAKWELDFLVRMQDDDGSVHTIVGQAGAKDPKFGGSPNTAPSTDTTPCKYGPVSTSATLSAAAAYAKAAMIYQGAFAMDLRTRAEKAWTWANANPNVVFTNAGKIGAGEQETDNAGRALKKLQAAVFLFKLTGDPKYKTYVDQNYASVGFVQSSYVDMFAVEDHDTLIDYALDKNATANVSQNILAKYKAGLDTDNNFGALTKNRGAYLGFIYLFTWGSNQIQSDQGNLFMDAARVDASRTANATRAAERQLHWLHGTNPLSLVYLSNMKDANKSITRFYHSWFAKGSWWDAAGVSKYGPPPGYLVGGPNPGYDWDPCCPSNCGGNSCGASAPSPPKGQPPQKSYADFNDGWPLDSWSISEPSDGYQVKYIRLLSKFVN